MAVDFSNTSSFSNTENFNSLKCGANATLLEVELDELQDIQNYKRNLLAGTILSNGFLNKPALTIASGTLTVPADTLCIDGDLFEVLENMTLAVTAADTVYLAYDIVQVTALTSLKKSGNLSGGTAISNDLIDSRIGSETSRRNQIQVELVKSNADSSKTYLDVAYIVDANTAQDLRDKIGLAIDGGSQATQYLIDGNFQISSTAGAEVTAPATGTYPVCDAWKVEFNDDGFTKPTLKHSRQILSPINVINSYYYYRINTNGAGTSLGTNTLYALVNPIKYGVRNLCGTNQQVTLRFKARSSIGSKSIGIFARQNYGTGGSPSSTQTLVGDNFLLTSSFQDFSCTFTTADISAKVFGTNNDDYLEIVFALAWGSGISSYVKTTTGQTFVGSGNIEISQCSLTIGGVEYNFTPVSAETEQYRIYGTKGITADPTSAPSGVTGYLGQWFSWITNRIKAVLGTSDWYTTPPTTLTAAKAHIDDSTIHIPYAGITTNVGNAYSISSPVITSLSTGMAVSFKINADSTGSVTLNWCSLGAKSVYRASGTAMASFKAGGIYTVRYDGTNFMLQGEGAGGNAVESDLLPGKTATVDSGEITGTMSTLAETTYTPTTTNQTIAYGQYLLGNQTILGDADLVSGNIRSGVNIFGVAGNSNVVDTTNGDAVAGDILLNKKAYVDGSLVTGTIPSKSGQTYTPTTTNQTITSGQYLTGNQIIEGDADLISANIKSGITIFGVAGNSNVVDTSAGDATAAQILSGKIAFVDGSQVTGTIPSKSAANYTPSTVDQTITSGQYLSGTQTIYGDADLISANIKSGITIFGVAGNSNVVDTSAGNAVAGDMLSGKVAFVDGAQVTGNIASKGAANYTPTTTNQTIASGQYLSGTQTIYGDANLVATNIRAGVTIFGVTGNSNVVDTSAGDAIAADILTGKKAYVDGAQVTGTMINNAAYKPIAGYKTMNNLLINSGFESGITGWTNGASDSDHYKYGTKCALVKSADGVGAMEFYQDNKYLVSGKKYYAGAWFMRTASLTNPGEFDVIKDGAEHGNISIDNTNLPQINTWYYLSFLFTCSASDYYRFRCYTYDTTGYYVDACTFINVTDSFGAGTEPTEEQLDTIMGALPTTPSWFEGSTIIQYIDQGAYLTNGLNSYPNILAVDSELIPDNIVYNKTIRGIAGVKHIVEGVVGDYVVGADTINIGDFVGFINGAYSNNLLAYNSSYVYTKNSGINVNAVSTATITACKFNDYTALIFYHDNDNGGDAMYCLVTISDNTLTVTTPVALTANTSSHFKMVQMGENKILLSFRDYSGSYHNYIKVLTLSGTTVTAAGTTTWSTAGMDSHALVYLSSTSALLFWRNVSSSNKGYAAVVTLSGSTPTVNTWYEVESNAIVGGDTDACLLSSNKVAVVYKDAGTSNYGTAKILTVSGTTISAGTKFQFSESIEPYGLGVVRLTNTSFAVVYRNAAPDGKIVVLYVSDTTISQPGSHLIFANNVAGNDGDARIRVLALSAGMVLIAYRNSTNDTMYYCQVKISDGYVCSNHGNATSIETTASIGSLISMPGGNILVASYYLTTQIGRAALLARVPHTGIAVEAGSEGDTIKVVTI